MEPSSGIAVGNGFDAAANLVWDRLATVYLEALARLP